MSDSPRPPRPVTPEPPVPLGAAAEAPRCVDGHCVTCADEGIPMRVVRIRDAGLALCEGEDGRRMDVLTGLVDGAREGDTLLVHAGTALLRLDPRTTEAP